MYARIYMDPQQEDKFISITPWDHTEQKNVSHLHVVFLEKNPVGGLKLALPFSHRLGFYLVYDKFLPRNISAFWEM